jgi:hypothetical protein
LSQNRPNPFWIFFFRVFRVVRGGQTVVSLQQLTPLFHSNWVQADAADLGLYLSEGKAASASRRWGDHVPESDGKG